jgi:hypothetical protein
MSCSVSRRPLTGHFILRESRFEMLAVRLHVHRLPGRCRRPARVKSLPFHYFAKRRRQAKIENRWQAEAERFFTMGALKLVALCPPEEKALCGFVRYS